MGLGRDWDPYGEIVTAEEPCGICGTAANIHLGYCPTRGIRFAGIQVAGWANEDVSVCENCGFAEHLGSEGRSEAVAQGSWSSSGKLGVGYIDVNSGRMKRRPLHSR